MKSIKKLNKCKDDSKLSSHLVHTTIPTLGLFCKFYHQPYTHLIFLQLFTFYLCICYRMNVSLLFYLYIYITGNNLD